MGDFPNSNLELEKLEKELDRETQGRELWSLEGSSKDVREGVREF